MFGGNTHPQCTSSSQMWTWCCGEEGGNDRWVSYITEQGNPFGRNKISKNKINKNFELRKTYEKNRS